MKNLKLFMVIIWLITILVPIGLVLVGVRLLMTPAFLQIEYNFPGFPDDSYGFTKGDRLYWSQIAVDYLLNREDISFLGDLRFEDGEVVYNDRELQHMVDVKRVVQWAMAVMYVTLLIILACGVWAWRTGWWVDFLYGLARGGWLTVIIFASMILFVMIGFDVFFVSFHNVFFTPGTWTFFFSDTLIRLFPQMFWQNAFFFVGAFTLIGGFFLGWFLTRKAGH